MWLQQFIFTAIYILSKQIEHIYELLLEGVYGLLYNTIDDFYLNNFCIFFFNNNNSKNFLKIL